MTREKMMQSTTSRLSIVFSLLPARFLRNQLLLKLHTLRRFKEQKVLNLHSLVQVPIQGGRNHAALIIELAHLAITFATDFSLSTVSRHSNSILMTCPVFWVHYITS